MAQQFEALLAGSLRGTELGASRGVAVLGVATCFRHGRSRNETGSMEPEETAVGRGGAPSASAGLGHGASHGTWPPDGTTISAWITDAGTTSSCRHYMQAAIDTS